MVNLTQDFDGRFTLEQTEAACEVVQRGGYRLQKIELATKVANNEVLLVNRAEFISDPLGGSKRLLFVEVGTQNPETLKMQKQSEGWSFISYSQIYVEGTLEWVMVFKKK
jgi:hypothetical protein